VTEQLHFVYGGGQKKENRIREELKESIQRGREVENQHSSIKRCWTDTHDMGGDEQGIESNAPYPFLVL
jgi:hypothetical protein